jgi:hypothetical protein
MNTCSTKHLVPQPATMRVVLVHMPSIQEAEGDLHTIQLDTLLDYDFCREVVLFINGYFFLL